MQRVNIELFVSGLQKLGIAVAFLNYNVKGQSLVHTVRACEAKVLILGEGEYHKSGLFPAILGKGPWPKLGKTDHLNIKVGRN